MKNPIIILIFLLGLVIHLSLAYFTPYSLSPDESHYWLWSKYLDYCYYSKGPLLALLIKLSTSLLGDSVFAIRLPALISFHLFSWALYYFLKELTSKKLALLSWVFVQTTPIFVQSALIMTTDSPVILLWLVSTICIYRAVFKSKNRFWVYGGIALALAVWAKYTALLLAATLFVYPLIFRKLSKDNLSWNHYLAGIISFLSCLAPIVVWNSKHDWVNFLHNGRHLYKAEKSSFNPGYFFELLGGQLGLLGPIFFFSICSISV